jgi:hypothetical protein
VRSAQNQWQRRQDLGQRRVFFIHPQVEFLQITYAGTDVRHFINSDGLAQGSAAGQHRHEHQQQASHDGEVSAARIFHQALSFH